MTWWSVARWEWFKLRGRRVIWILLAVLVLFGSIFVLLRFGDYQFRKDAPIRDEALLLPGTPPPEDDLLVDCEDFVAGVMPTEFPAGLTLDDVDIEFTTRECTMEIADIQKRLAILVDEFTLPGAIPKALRWTQLISIPILAFFTVLVIGSEYGWGTLRTVLMRGTGRRRVLSVKLALILGSVAVAWLLALAAIVLTSFIVTAIANVSHGSFTSTVGGDVVVDILKAWTSGLPYIALAALLTVLFSTRAGGTLAAVGVATSVFFLELFTMGRLIKLFDGASGFGWFASVAEFDLGWNVAGWMFGRGGEPISGFALAGAIGTADYPPDLQALVVLLAYTALFGLLAFRIFSRRDVTGPSG